MAGYSGTPLLKKLGIREGHRVAFPGAPDGFAKRPGGRAVDRLAEGVVGSETDLKFLDVQAVGLANRLVDKETSAIDETLSGARMVIRLEDRPD